MEIIELTIFIIRFYVHIRIWSRSKIFYWTNFYLFYWGKI